jgi:hypothetical protein
MELSTITSMTTQLCRDVARIVAGKSTLLLIATASLAVGCVSAGRNSLHAPLTTRVSRAGVTPGSWARVEALSPGSPLLVVLKNGDRIEGAFLALRREMLALTDSAGTELNVPRSEVRTIVARGTRDDLTNGALSGAGIGAGAAVAILAVLSSGDGYILPSAKWGAPLLLSSVGAVVGAVIDRAHTGEQLLYVAP